ncbi:hypothetical protein B0J17DRAFT_769501 [Rhizoctonia solani]|nr:hypothetical protein B0J17DRAFT_769501 [Rhizoctonia solani]
MSSTSGGAVRPLKQYIDDSFHFSIAEQVYQFLNILCEMSTKKSWSTEDAQLQLREFVEGNGIMRLEDTIRFPVDTSRPWSFQRGYVPIFVYITSESVIKKGLHVDINKLYGVINNNIKVIRDTIETHMPKLIEARSFKNGHKPLSGRIVFRALFSAIYEYVIRFKAAASDPGVSQLVERLAGWFDAWAIGLSSKPPFDDECARFENYQKESIIETIGNDKERLLALFAQPKSRNIDRGARRQEISEGLIANLQRTLDNDGPGHLRKAGARHDNDHVRLRDIGVDPTPGELLCDEDPYLPGNFFDAPHHLESRSVGRLFDIQFRLLREEMIAPVQTAVQCVVSDLKKPSTTPTMLSKIIREGGGRYVSPDTQDSVMFSVYTNITFQPLSLDNRGMSLGIEFDAPPGDARSDSAETRTTYWEKTAKKRLTQGALIVLIWKDPIGKMDIYVGTVTSIPADLVASSRQRSDRVSIKASFFDAAAEFRVLSILQSRRGTYGTRLLIEAPVFYEGVRPFLEALQRNPSDLPFLTYLRYQSKADLKRTEIHPPSYSTVSNFTFDLKELFPSGQNARSLNLKTTDFNSIAHAKSSLLLGSRLDPSQVDAVVDSLTRELSLIQGPPGTGKSYTGLQLIRVLVKSEVSPILLVAFTNQALDHMLKDILDEEITANIVRLGSRFAVDESLAHYSLEELEKGAGSSSKRSKNSEMGAAYKEMKEIEGEMAQLMRSITRGRIPGDQMEGYLSSSHPRHFKELVQNTPAWISVLFSEATKGRLGWSTAGKLVASSSKVDFWLDGRDIRFLEPPQTHAESVPQPLATSNRYMQLTGGRNPDPAEQNSDHVSKHQAFVYQHIRQHGLHAIPPIPTTNRLPRELQSDPRVWCMSITERRRLYDAWYMPASELIRQQQLNEFKSLRRRHSLALFAFNEAKEEYKAKLLREADIVGCTTTGAAKLVSILSEMKPKVLIVEEAGQVLESHILASLVKSVEHLIMIGDPLQLRPNINSWKLSSDNPVTGKIYRFNQSLMERLSMHGFPMAQLDVQRRMRPSISSLIRNTLYPNLQDNHKVLAYPDVRGMDKNIFFVSHEILERGGGEESVSKHNEFEVDLIHDLVAHLLRQGCYNDERNIVVLAAYLGQVPKIQQRLQGLVTTVLDDRDAELLAEHGLEEAKLATTREMNISKRVLVRTLDNFQGEEGDVIILSLVRNSGTRFNGQMSSLQFTGGRSPIGFLKSKNRTNVGISRAKHGLYIFGNAPELARGSDMWAHILQEIHLSGCVGRGFPIKCHKHPDYVQWIEQPGQLEAVAPDGGCLQPCLEILPCSHRCPFKCHPDDPQHVNVRCKEPCQRTCPLSHPCDRECGECSRSLQDCRFPMTNVPLPCGHKFPCTQCHIARQPEKIQCITQVEKQLPSCDHRAWMLCHEDEAKYRCSVYVQKPLPACEHSARMLCPEDPAAYTCQVRVEKKLPQCEHSATMACSQDPATFTCLAQCGVPFSCCSRTCLSKCGDCQRLNRSSSDSTTESSPKPISRVVHPKHQCGRIAFCGHACRLECKIEHVCSRICTDLCRQVCSHGASRLACSAPCSPCAKPCVWKCPHYQCTGTCGMPCMRLPCDKPCPGKLPCRHPCPSVCGEPCSRQTCSLCAPNISLNIGATTHTRLHNPRGGHSLDSMTITLPCRHAFTVAALDQAVGLNDFYERNETGQWSKPIMPGGVRAQPTCPTCSGHIDSLRYGRIIKGSRLASLQHHIAAGLSQQLADTDTQLAIVREGLTVAISSCIQACISSQSPGSSQDGRVTRNTPGKLDTVLSKEPDRPTAPELIENINRFHSFSDKDAKAWKNAISGLIIPYRAARELTRIQDPSIQPYQKALAQLSREEAGRLRVLFSQQAPGGQTLEQYASQLAKPLVGQFPPRATHRFTVEAFWITGEILVLLGKETSSATSKMRGSNTIGSTIIASWEQFAEFLLLRGVKDCEKASEIATTSESWNKAIKCQVLTLQAHYELALHKCRVATDHGLLSDHKTTNELEDLCLQNAKNIREQQVNIQQEYLKKWGSLQGSGRRHWFQENFIRPSNIILKYWEALRQSIGAKIRFNSEMEGNESATLASFLDESRHARASSVDHFYQCGNGHTYTFTECNLIDGRNTCPECGVWVEDASHQQRGGIIAHIAPVLS